MRTVFLRLSISLIVVLTVFALGAWAVQVSSGYFAPPPPLTKGVQPLAHRPEIVAGSRSVEKRSVDRLLLTYPEAAVEGPDNSIFIANALGFTIERVVDGVAETALTGSPTDRRPSIFLDVQREGDTIYALDGANARVWRRSGEVFEVAFEAPPAPDFDRPGNHWWSTDYMLSSMDVLDDRFLFSASRVIWQGQAQQYSVENNALYIAGAGVWEEVPGSFEVSKQLGNFRDAIWNDDGSIVAIAGEHLVHIGTQGDVSSVFLDNDGFGGGIVPAEGGWLVGAHTNLLFVADNMTSTEKLEVGFPAANIGHLSWTGDGNLLVTDTDRQSVYVYDVRLGKIVAQYGNISGIAFKIVSLASQADRLLLLDNATPRVMSYDPDDGAIYQVAGDGAQGYEGPGAAQEFSLLYPSSIAVGKDGSVIASDANYRLVRIAGGYVSIYAGDIHSGKPEEGEYIRDARFGSLRGMDFDHEGRLLVVDQTHHSVWRFEFDGTVSKVMGTGEPGQWRVGGLATNQPLNHPTGILVREDGTILIADSYNNVVVGIDDVGRAFTFAGTMKGQTYQGNGDYEGDGGPASLSKLNTPRNMAEDNAGNVYIVDEFNNAIRKVTPEGVISSFAGGRFGFTESGTHLNLPQDAEVLGDHLYVADTGNSMVWAFPLE